MDEHNNIGVGLLSDDHLLREGLEALIRGTGGLCLVGSWGDAGSALHALPANPPDVLLVDIKLPHGTAFELLKALPKAAHIVKPLVMVECREESCFVLSPAVIGGLVRSRQGISTQFARPDDCLQIALKSGAHGAIRRHCTFAQLDRAIRDVYEGHTVIESATAQRLAEQYLVSFRHSHVEPESTVDTLTLRERQIVQLISQGRSNKEISREMQIAYSTVKNYVSSILEKLDLQDRTQIALYAVSATNAIHPACTAT